MYRLMLASSLLEIGHSQEFIYSIQESFGLLDSLKEQEISQDHQVEDSSMLEDGFSFMSKYF